MHIHYTNYPPSINTSLSTSGGEIIPNKYSSLLIADKDVFVSLRNPHQHNGMLLAV
jgi:hypothetical protein